MLVWSEWWANTFYNLFFETKRTAQLSPIKMETTVKIQIITNVNALLGNSTRSSQLKRRSAIWNRILNMYNFGWLVDNASLSAKSFIIHFVCRINVFTINKSAIKLTLNLFRRGGSSPGSKTRNYFKIFCHSVGPSHSFTWPRLPWFLFSSFVLSKNLRNHRHIKIEIGCDLCGHQSLVRRLFLGGFGIFAFVLI